MKDLIEKIRMILMAHPECHPIDKKPIDEDTQQELGKLDFRNCYLISKLSQHQFWGRRDEKRPEMIIGYNVEDPSGEGFDWCEIEIYFYDENEPGRYSKEKSGGK